MDINPFYHLFLIVLCTVTHSFVLCVSVALRGDILSHRTRRQCATHSKNAPIETMQLLTADYSGRVINSEMDETNLWLVDLGVPQRHSTKDNQMF